MTIRTRLALWYAAILGVSLMVLAGVLYYEWEEQQHRILDELKPPEPVWHEVGEIVLMFGVPAAALLLVGGSLLLGKSLRPITALTRAAESIDLDYLQQRLPMTGSGDELDRLTEVFNAMLGRLQTSVAHVREFTLHASHELKTPLTVMRTATETALREETLSPAQRDLLAGHLEEIQRLTQIVNSLSFLARADAGLAALQFGEVQFDELVRDSFADSQAMGRARRISVHLAACEGVVVRGDRHRLRQLLLNLTDNAIKYNETNGRVVIALERRDGVAELTVSNTGPGIPQESLPRVFERFFRGEPAHRGEIDGCGLGLSIVEWIVKSHRGDVTLQSEPRGLTTVKVSLPVGQISSP